ncbi:MAG: hypothetical protein MSC30_13810 [Gaiellaceae bacterium MAG52_C11]|nr:hypothetical protein [Candidatus Gaiellasilicea maunaloa]
MSYIQAWGVVADELEHTPTAEEYAIRFQLRVATAYRDQALFRAAFGEETPARILDVLWDAARGSRLRHILSAPVVLALDAPDDASLVLGWFVATVLDRLPPGAAAHVDRAVAPLAGTCGDRRTEVERAYRLADRAVFDWFEATLRHAGEEGRQKGLHSLERLRPFAAEAAAYAAAILDEYAGGLDREAVRAAGSAKQSAAAVASLGLRVRRDDEQHLVVAAQSAADTLVGAFAAGALSDVVTPSREVVLTLLARGRASTAD